MADVVTIVGGVEYAVGDIAHVGDLTRSTAWPYGCFEASWTVDLPPNTYPRALTANAWVEIWDGPVRVWVGYLSEPVPGEPWTCHAKGWYAAFASLLCLTADQSTTSAVPNVVVPAAITRAGLPITVVSTLPSTSITSGDETVSANYVLPFMDAWTSESGQRWSIDADYRLTVAADPTVARYVYDSTEALRGTADDDYVTDAYPRFVATVDPVSGDPTTYGLGHVATASQPAGRRERAMDVTSRGLMVTADANSLAQGQLDLNGARMGYTNGLDVVYGELVRPGGSPVRLGLVKAGEMLTAFNVADASGQVQLGMTADVVIGRTTYRDGDSVLAVQPVDMAARMFVDTLVALKAPGSFAGTAA